MHLNVIRRQMNMSKLGLNALGSIPKNMGALPPLLDTNFEHAITNSACTHGRIRRRSELQWRRVLIAVAEFRHHGRVIVIDSVPTFAFEF